MALTPSEMARACPRWVTWSWCVRARPCRGGRTVLVVDRGADLSADEDDAGAAETGRGDPGVGAPSAFPLLNSRQGVAGTFGFPAISDSGSGQHVASLYVSPDVVPR